MFLEKEKIISNNFPKHRVKNLIHLFKNNITLRTSMMSEALNISDKTAISYLKVLEEKNIVYSVMYGREKVYFNSGIVEIMCNEGVI